MNNKLIILSALLLLSSLVSAQDQSRYKYINKYKNIAIKEMERTGIPASIKLAQGLLESGAGQSTLAKKANNHFGIKCHSSWTGKTYYLEDDDFDSNGNLIKSCFRVYKNANSSYIAHSEFLRDPKKRYRYGFLFNLDPTDYKAWSKGLKKAGYATSPTYAEKLIRIIETYELYRYDNVIISDDNGPVVTNQNQEIRKNNDVKYIVAKAGELASDIARRGNVSTSRVVKYNEKISSGNQSIKENTYVYLQCKRKNYRGKKKWHTVRAGESLFSLSQQYGIRLKNLYKRNRLKEGQEPAAGERIKLRGWKVPKSQRPHLSNETIEEEKDPWLKEEVKDDGSIITDPPIEEDEEFGNDFELEIEKENPNTPTPDPEPVYYTVQKGDTLYGIARTYGTLVETIMQLNNMSNTVLSIGQRLRVQ